MANVIWKRQQFTAEGRVCIFPLAFLAVEHINNHFRQRNLITARKQLQVLLRL